MYGSLLITTPAGARAVTLDKAQLLIGRADECDIKLDDALASRRHALLTCAPDGVRVMDNGSANGTFIGAEKIAPRQPVPLTAGAQFRIGQTVFTYQPPAPARTGDELAVTSAPPPAAAEASRTMVKPRAEKPAAPGGAGSKPAPAAKPGGAGPEPPSGGPPPSFQPPAPPAPEPAPAETAPVGLPRERSSYVRFLPPLYSADDFIGRFLLIFEHIFSPIERTVDNIPHYFDPRLTPPDFLPWLASWVGLTLDERWPEARRRELILAAAELYAWRGTVRGVREFVRLYTGYEPDITEPGVTGKRAVEAGQAHRFVVRVRVPDPASVNRALLESVLNAEKPAHTAYQLIIEKA